MKTIKLKYKSNLVLENKDYTLSQVTNGDSFSHHWWEIENKDKKSNILGFISFDEAYEEFKNKLELH